MGSTRQSVTCFPKGVYAEMMQADCQGKASPDNRDKRGEEADIQKYS